MFGRRLNNAVKIYLYGGYLRRTYAYLPVGVVTKSHKFSIISSSRYNTESFELDTVTKQTLFEQLCRHKGHDDVVAIFSNALQRSSSVKNAHTTHGLSRYIEGNLFSSHSVNHLIIEIKYSHKISDIITLFDVKTLVCWQSDNAVAIHILTCKPTSTLTPVANIIKNEVNRILSDYVKSKSFKIRHFVVVFGFSDPKGFSGPGMQMQSLKKFMVYNHNIKRFPGGIHMDIEDEPLEVKELKTADVSIRSI